MKIHLLSTLALISIFTFMPGYALAQVKTQGCASPVVYNSKVSRLEISCGTPSAELLDLIKRANGLAAKNAISSKELKGLSVGINRRIDELGDDIADLRAIALEILSIIKSAEKNPTAAQSILRPYIEAPLDLTNSAYDISEFLDVRGRDKHTVTFEVTGNCRLFVSSDGYRGRKVAGAVYTTYHSRVWSSYLTRNGRYEPIPISTGVYKFILKAQRDAGQYEATIAARCD